MDHPCYKCGHSTEDGKAFCAECGAPQIRVAVAEVVAEPVPAGGGSAPALPFEAQPAPRDLAANLGLLGRSYAARSCALAAMVAVVPMFFGLNPFLTALATGFLAVAFARRVPGTVPNAGSGGRLGALSGLLLFALSTILEMLAVTLLHKGAEIRSEMMDKIQQAASRYPSPEVQPFLDFVKSPGGFGFMMVASLVFGLVAFVVLGSCGGALGAALLGRRDRR
jgi:hypothetical protein